MASNRRWRGQFRYRGSRHESAVAQLSTFGMKRRFPIFIVMVACLLLVLVALGWYASENLSGRLGKRLMGLGDAVVWPGRMADAMLSGNLGGFGGWCSGGIRILVSWLVWC